MSIIYSYPEQSPLNADDLLIGTSSELVGGKKRNVTKNFSLAQIRDFIGVQSSVIGIPATENKIPMFSEQGAKIVDSIVSQDSVTGSISIAGDISSVENITSSGNLVVSGNVTFGNGSAAQTIQFRSPTFFAGTVKDQFQILGQANQILVSDAGGRVTWTNYLAGLTYQGTWDADTNTPTLATNQGTNGHFYIVSVDGTTNLNGNADWHVGDWAIFVNQGAGGVWQKIDNTSQITGGGLPNNLTMWVDNFTVTNAPILNSNGSIIKINKLIS